MAAIHISLSIQVAMETNHAGAQQHISSARKPLKVMIAGAPAAGKGTQCEKIVKKVRCCHAVGSLA